MLKSQLRVLAFVAFGFGGGHVLSGQQIELRSLADNLATDVAAAGKKSLAVVDFTDLQGNPTELGRYLAEEFSVAMARTHKGFEIIDRAHLKAILTENKLASTGLIDPATAKKLGQIVGADALLTGSMTPFSETVRITIKVLSTDTARIVAADTVDLPKTATITELLGTGLGPKEDRPRNTSTSLRPPSSSSGSSSPASPTPSSPVIVSNELVYELLECQGQGGSVRCTFKITNRGPDTNLSLRCRQGFRTNPEETRAFDNLGNESWGSACTLSNAEMGFEGITARLVSGVAVPASVLFNNLSSSASTLSLVTIDGYRINTGNATVSFRNVPILR